MVEIKLSKRGYELKSWDGRGMGREYWRNVGNGMGVGLGDYRWD